VLSHPWASAIPHHAARPLPVLPQKLLPAAKAGLTRAYAERIVEDRRALLKTLFAASLAAAAPTRSRAAEVIHRQPLPGDFEGLDATFVEVVFEPGQSSDTHRHPGFVLGYVLEGQFRFALKEQAEKILGPGEVFYEPPDAVHQSSGSAGDTAARILAIIVAEKGAPITMPV
jgi:quercetin dioxygenase-like cupin family protein